MQWFFCFIMIASAACSPKLILSGSEKTLYPIKADQPKDQEIVAYYMPYKMQLDSQMNEVLAVSAIEIIKARPEGPLNNLMADAMYDAGKSNNIPFDIAYTNYGGLRVPLPKGNIQLFRVFELMPFENVITTVRFSGVQMQKFFDYMAGNGGDPISGVTFKIKDKKATDIMINGQAFQLEKSYTVLTSDYMANGGEDGSVFLQATDRKEYNIKLRDALIAYIKKQSAGGKQLNPKKDGRITVE